MPSDVELLVTKNQGLVYCIVRKFVEPQSQEFNDLFSVGVIGLIKAADTFDESKAIKFSTYSSKCITNEILMYLRKSKSSFRNSISLEDVIACDSDGNELILADCIFDKRVSFVHDFENRDLCKRILDTILNELPSRDTLLILYHIGGLTQKTIAKMLHVSQSYISRLLVQIRQRLQFLSDRPEKEPFNFHMELTDEFYFFHFSIHHVHRFYQLWESLQGSGLKFREIAIYELSSPDVVRFPPDLESFVYLADMLQYFNFFQCELLSATFEQHHIIPKF